VAPKPVAALLSLIALSVCPLPARAQQTPQLPGWDVGLIAGSFAGHARIPEETAHYYGDDWYHTGQAGVFVGRHWTTHFKTEVGFIASGEGRRSVPRMYSPPGISYPILYSIEQRTQVRSLTATAAWQFFDNNWVHPFIEAGVTIDRQRTRLRDPGFIYYPDPRNPLPIPGRAEEERIETAARVLVGGGVKLYVTPRFFFRADARGVRGARFAQLAFRGGVGLDF
jgi:hypothetical protein